MKVRIGVAAGAGVADDGPAFLELVDALDELGFDSIWVPDVITTPTLDPIAALSVAAGRRSRLKLGTHLIIPGRNPVLLAKQLATLDQLSNGRLLLMAVLGLRQPAELAAQGVEAKDRPAMLERSVEIMRTLWAGEEHEGVRLQVQPKQKPLELWFGGQVPAALRRCGRIGEGWMPGMVTPAEASAMRKQIEAAAAEYERTIDAEHFGMNVSWVDTDRGITDDVRTAVAARRPDLNADDIIGIGPDGLAAKLQSFLDVGFSKFVVRPAQTPSSWPDAVAAVAEVVALQT